MTDESPRIAVSFDGWVLLREPLELQRDGRRLHLQELPLRILELLISRAGQLVTREELIARLWPKGVVDFDAGINTAMRKLRATLGDDADAPRYIETVPRRGYRFIAQPTGAHPRAGAVEPRPARDWRLPAAVLVTILTLALSIYALRDKPAPAL